MFSFVCGHNGFILLRCPGRQPLWWVWGGVLCGFSLHFPNSKWYWEESFRHSPIFFSYKPIQILYQMSNWVTYFLINAQEEFLLYSGYKNFTIFMICKYFHQSVTHLHLLNGVLWNAKTFKFLWSQIYHFFFDWLCFDIISTNALPNPGHEDFLLEFL